MDQKESQDETRLMAKRINKGNTTEELLAELGNDPEYQARARERISRHADRFAETKKELSRIILDLNALGYEGETVEKIVELHAPLSTQISSYFIGALESMCDNRAKESVIRALAASRSHYDGTVLCRILDATDDINLQWVIINTLALSRPRAIEEWLTSKLRDEYFSKTYLALKQV